MAQHDYIYKTTLWKLRCGARRGNVLLLLIYLKVQHAKHPAVIFLNEFKEKCYLLCFVTLKQTNYSFVAS